MANQETDISWALKLLEREQDYEPNFLSKHWAYICAPLTGVAIPIMMNLWLKRPPFAGIQRHIAGGIIGYGIGHLLTEREKFVLARRDAMLRDYIRLHPDDFPPPDRKKFGELFLDWTPIR